MFSILHSTEILEENDTYMLMKHLIIKTKPIVFLFRLLSQCSTQPLPNLNVDSNSFLSFSTFFCGFI